MPQQRLCGVQGLVLSLTIAHGRPSDDLQHIGAKRCHYYSADLGVPALTSSRVDLFVLFRIRVLQHITYFDDAVSFRYLPL